MLARGADPSDAGGVTGSLRVVGEVAREDAVRLEVATKLQTLEDVLRWGGDVVEVVVQDEYTHDVVVRVRDVGPYLVFDTT